MATQRFIDLDSNGNLIEVVPNITSAGSGDSGKIVALNASGQIDSTMLAATSTINMTASENVSAGGLVNVWNSPSNPTGIAIRNADNSSVGKEANGFVSSAVSTNASTNVTLDNGVISGLSGLTPGAQYFMATVGGITITPPTTAGAVLQKIGRALSATSLAFLVGTTVMRA